MADKDQDGGKGAKLRVLEFYSGIGGMHYALKEAGLADAVEVVAAFDINTVANEVYTHNFGGVPVQPRLIESIPAVFFERLAADVWTMSPPCQPFTRTGKQQASSDPRTKSFLTLLGLLKTLEHRPKYLLMENVKGFDESDTRRQFVEVLTATGYQYQEYLITPEQIGLPNSRLRYYVIASLEGLASPPTGTILKTPPPTAPTTARADPAEVSSERGAVKRRRVVKDQHLYAGRTIRSFLDPTIDADPELARPYQLDPKTVCRLTRVLDIVTPESTRSMCFTKGYGMYAEGTGSVLQPLPIADDGSDDRRFHEHESWAGWGAGCQCNACWTERDSAVNKQPAAAAAAKDAPAPAKTAPEGAEAVVAAPRPPKHKPPVHGDAEPCPLMAFGLRYFTAREISRLMGFPDDFTFPEKTTLKQQRRLLGNSLNVSVVASLMKQLLA